MMTSAEMKFVVPKGGSFNVEKEGIFRKVPASELRLDDAFMKHIPRTKQEERFRNWIETAIKNGLKDFWCPICDPSFDDAGRICYVPGMMPAVNKSYNWWEENAKKFCPEKGSRIGTKPEHVAFLATLIKEFIANGWSVDDAWHAVCIDFTALGHYRNSKDAKNSLELTGSREVYGWYDLANTSKILAEDNEARGYWLAGGDFCYDGNFSMLAALYTFSGRRDRIPRSCGWLVFDSCPG